MIFDFSNTTFESEKERNLYYKIFAGYFLNELIPGYRKRLRALCDLINDSKERGKAAPTHELQLDYKTSHASFDNHIYLLFPKHDRGEFADILIQDEPNKTLVTIETKLHSNWSYHKDISSNKTRLDLIQQALPNIRLFPILLVSQIRWENVKKLKSIKHGNYFQFQNEPDCPFIVILWEQLVELIDNIDVRQFLSSQLDHDNTGYTYQCDGKWFRKSHQSFIT